MLKQLQSQSYYRDPFPVIQSMRKSGSLVKTRIPILGKVWLTTTQSATAQILKNSAQFSVRKPDGKVAGLSWWMPTFIQRLANNMLSMDEPEHTRLRSIVDGAFQRRAIADMEAQIRSLSLAQSRLLEASREPVDLIKNYARPFPLAVICELLGLPKQDREQFMAWASGITTVKGLFSFLLALQKLKPMTRYIEMRIEEERREGGNGLVHDLVSLESEELSNDELVSMIFLLLMAGHETTTHLISGGIYALLGNPEQLALLREDTDHIDLAVEELLRFVSPVQTTKPRYVRNDCNIDGVTLKKGDLIMPFLAAANFDPEIFDYPDKLDITRKPNRHMEFGSGPHFCLGNQLARLEMKVALQTLLLGDRTLELAVRSGNVKWSERFGLRALQSLPVRFALPRR